MSITIQEIRKKKLSKSYDELLSEVKNLFSKSGTVYIPELCEALAVEHTDWSNRDIQDKVYGDLKGMWAPGYIETCLPSWIHNPGKVATSKKGWETRNANKLKSAKKIFAQLENVDVPERPQVSASEPKYTPVDDEELDKELHSMQMGKFGDTGKSVRELYGDITHHCNGLFEVMTQKEIPYADNEDLMLDYIKPSREHWRSLMLEFDEAKRTRTHNCLSFIAELIEDRLEILKDVQNK